MAGGDAIPSENELDCLSLTLPKRAFGAPPSRCKSMIEVVPNCKQVFFIFQIGPLLFLEST